MPEESENGVIPPVASVVPLDAICGGDELDTKLLKEMAEEAIRYVRSFRWCIELHEKYFGDGYGGIVAIFLFRVTIRGFKVPEWIWVIVGDLPSAYLEQETFESSRAALLRYIEGVEEWLATPEEERSTNDLIPIFVPPGAEYLEMLAGRMKTLRDSILPNLRDTAEPQAI